MPGRLSSRRRALALELDARRRHEGVGAVFTSDLRRAVETAKIAFAGSDIPVLHDSRLRECEHGERNGAPLVQVKPRLQQHLSTPYPRGESWMQAVDRVAGFVRDLPALGHATHCLSSGISPPLRCRHPAPGRIPLPWLSGRPRWECA